MVGDDVTITVLGVKGNQVRVGVDAPKDVGVHREEIYQRIQREKLIKLEAALKAGQNPNLDTAMPETTSYPSEKDEEV